MKTLGYIAPMIQFREFSAPIILDKHHHVNHSPDDRSVLLSNLLLRSLTRILQRGTGSLWVHPKHIESLSQAKNTVSLGSSPCDTIRDKCLTLQCCFRCRRYGMSILWCHCSGTLMSMYLLLPENSTMYRYDKDTSCGKKTLLFIIFEPK